MQPLDGEKCIACHSESPHATKDDIKTLKPQVPLWNLKSENRVRKLERIFQIRKYESALSFTHEIGELAEEEGHHPRIVTEWGKVTVTWWTLAIGDLHRNDFIMAAKTDRLFENMSS
jgi:4a-hydroxytetrahydrobiopterin dehydratase